MKRFLIPALAAGLLGLLLAAAAAKNPVVVIETSMGTIKVELDEAKAPITVKNFLSYVDAKHYDDTIFHRVMGKENTRDMRDFMIQGGGFSTDRKEKDTKAPIKNEAGNGLSNARGTIAMARTSDPDSASAQFYINVADNTFLDRANAADRVGYAVFGKVIEGMDVVDKIKAVKTGVGELEMKTPTGQRSKAPSPNVPVENVVIKSIRRADK